MNAFSPWCPPPKTLTLGNDEVHVWRASLNLPASYIFPLQQTLAPDECARAERFHFQRDRDRFIVARGGLRDILSRYLNTKSDQLRFCYNSHGKPALARKANHGELGFNLAHSHELALYAITRGREVGIDLERIRSNLVDEQIAERFFSPREVVVLRGLPMYQQREAFFNCWTRKEAYVKAKGQGLSIPLDQFDVSLAPGEPAALLSTQWHPQEASRWSLQKLNPGCGYVAALAVEGHDWQVECWQWSADYPF